MALARTKPNRPWVLKMGLFLTVLFAGGSWFLWDAMVAYPARGWKDVSYRLLTYLEAAEGARGLRISELAVDDPRADYALLRDRAKDGTLSALEGARYEWFRALYSVGALTPEMVEAQLIDDPGTEAVTTGPRERLAELRQAWGGPNPPNPPKPLASWDISVQWTIAVVCFALGLGLLIHVARILGVRYQWDAEEKRLHLPGGATLTPGDLEDVDKRLWHKFFVFLKVKDGHEKLGGKEIKLDLYPHANLEEWVLEMERTAFPDRQEEEEKVESATEESQ